jgi:hypothetical protein
VSKFLVFIDADKPYEVESPSRCDATLDAMGAHRTAKRISVKPVEFPYQLMRARASQRRELEKTS